jgi:hypothetical protein
MRLRNVGDDSVALRSPSGSTNSQKALWLGYPFSSISYSPWPTGSRPRNDVTHEASLLPLRLAAYRIQRIPGVDLVKASIMLERLAQQLMWVWCVRADV